MTSNGKMRGGSKSQFDVDIILFTNKIDDYRQNYIFPDKNYYNKIPPSELKYSIYYQSVLLSKEITDVSYVHFEEVENETNTKFSNLVATPVN